MFVLNTHPFGDLRALPFIFFTLLTEAPTDPILFGKRNHTFQIDLQIFIDTDHNIPSSLSEDALLPFRHHTQLHHYLLSIGEPDPTSQ